MVDINSYSPQSGRIIGEDGKTYNLVDLLKNVGGGNSMEFLYGDSTPSTDIGSDGDLYLNTTNGNLYKKEDSEWNLLMNLKGPNGGKGDTGNQGPPGFGTEAQYNDIISRLETLEALEGGD